MSERPLHFLRIEDEAALRRCYPLMAELRPHLGSADALCAAWRRQQAEGYRLTALCQATHIVTLAGYRVQHNLVHGRFLYVDDLVTTASHRQHRYGAGMLDWLKEEARRLDCAKLLLDTPLHNALGQRFYFRHGLLARALRFSLELDGHAY